MNSTNIVQIYFRFGCVEEMIEIRQEGEMKWNRKTERERQKIYEQC